MQTNFKAAVAPAMVYLTSYSSCKSDAAFRQNRKLMERILIAAHEACDLGDLDVAAQLLLTLENVFIQKGLGVEPQHRRTMESLIAAHCRLWQLRYSNGASAESVGQMGSFHGHHVSEELGE